MKEIKILAIETSCDETAAAVICGANESYKLQETSSKQIPNSKFEIPKILSNVVSSSANLHAKTGGIVPEVASRAQMEAMLPVVEQALQQASEKLKAKSVKLKSGDLLEGITHVAVTNGPGLVGSLLVGFNAAKTIAYARKLPFVPVNHIEGHIYSALAQNRAQSEKRKAQNSGIEFPVLALTVSGGHTSLTLMKDHGVYETIGETIDDAAGEAFDKVAKLLDLGYPGGPEVSKLASQFRAKSEKRKAKNSGIKFPRPLIDRPNFDFSFSGLKTAVLTHTIKHPVKTTRQKEEICYAFEEAVVDVLVAKTIRAVKKYKPKVVILAGGVAANKRLREELEKRLISFCHPEQREGSRDSSASLQNDIKLLMPPMELCGDNAAMIGLAAYYHIIKGDKFDLPANTSPVRNDVATSGGRQAMQAGLFGTTVDSNLDL